MTKQPPNEEDYVGPLPSLITAEGVMRFICPFCEVRGAKREVVTGLDNDGKGGVYHEMDVCQEFIVREMDVFLARCSARMKDVKS